MIAAIGKDNYGLYILASSLISMFMLDFGISAAVTRFISKYNAEKNQESVNNLLGFICKVFIAIDTFFFIVVLFFFFLIDQIYIQLTPAELNSFKVVYVIAATFSIISFPFTALNGILISYEKFKELKLCELLNKVISVLLIILALLFGYGLYALVTVNAISGLVIIVIKLIIIKRTTSIKIKFSFVSHDFLKELISYSFWTTVVSISQRFIFNITPTILGAVSSSANIALFGIASILEGYVYTFANVINGLFLPRVSQIVIEKRSQENILGLMIKVGRIQLIIIGLIVVGFISVGIDFIKIWLGEEFIAAYSCVVALILPSLIALPQEIANMNINAENKVKFQAYVFVIMALINIILSGVLSQCWGAYGASVSIAISYFIRCILMNFVYYKFLNINVFKFFRECHLKMLGPLVITLLIVLELQKYLSGPSLMELLINIGTVIAIYILIMWNMAFNNTEKNLFFNTFQFLKRGS